MAGLLEPMRHAIGRYRLYFALILIALLVGGVVGLATWANPVKPRPTMISDDPSEWSAYLPMPQPTWRPTPAPLAACLQPSRAPTGDSWRDLIQPSEACIAAIAAAARDAALLSRASWRAPDGYCTPPAGSNGHEGSVHAPWNCRTAAARIAEMDADTLRRWEAARDTATVHAGLKAALIAYLVLLAIVVPARLLRRRADE